MENISREKLEEHQQSLIQAEKEIHKIIVGLDRIIENVLIAILADGHVLVEGVPGLGKTMLVQTLSSILDLEYSRIQFTPDLMPADITGTNILMEDADGSRFFEFQEGPLFAQLILADEINRATPKTQSALLEAMQEQSVTAGGKTRELKSPFFVFATQNPLEMEGTYPLPEAQIDRFFFKLKVDYPNFDELKEILVRTTGQMQPETNSVIKGELLAELQQLVRRIPVATEVLEYAVRITIATQPQSENSSDLIKQYVNYGSSPRGAQALILAGKARAFLQGRFNVSFEDIRKVALPSLRHRLLLNFEGEASDIEVEDIINQVVESVPESG